VSRAFRVLTCLAGVLLLGFALAIVGYAVSTDERVSDLGWLAVLAFGLLGPLLLWRAANWNQPRYCSRCGAEVSPDVTVCPRCGLSFDASTWAAIGELKLP
jgi:hypothetical protein